MSLALYRTSLATNSPVVLDSSKSLGVKSCNLVSGVCVCGGGGGGGRGGVTGVQKQGRDD